MDFSRTSEKWGTRVGAIVVGVLLVLALAACGGGSGSTTSGATASTTTGATAAAGGDAAAGREVFISTGCGTCHTLEEADATGTVGPSLDTDLVPSAEAAGAPLAEHVRTSIVNPDAWVMPRYAAAVMPSNFGSQLSETQLDDLVAFIVQSTQ